VIHCRGLLLAIASSISHDLLKGVMMPDISEKGELMESRISMAGAVMDKNRFFGILPNAFGAVGVLMNFVVAPSCFWNDCTRTRSNTGFDCVYSCSKWGGICSR